MFLIIPLTESMMLIQSSSRQDRECARASTAVTEWEARHSHGVQMKSIIFSTTGIFRNDDFHILIVPYHRIGFAYVPTLMAWYDFHHLKSRKLQAKVVECSRRRREGVPDYGTFDN